MGDTKQSYGARETPQDLSEETLASDRSLSHIKETEATSSRSCGTATHGADRALRSHVITSVQGL